MAGLLGVCEEEENGMANSCVLGLKSMIRNMGEGEKELGKK